MSRDVEQPTRNEREEETHPAFGLIGASRGQNGGGGAVLFDSDIRHGQTVRIRIAPAIRKRDLNRDWVGVDSRSEVVEVELSEAQWASFVSSMNVGDGVPCTIRRRGHEQMPGVPYAPRLAESMKEVEGAAEAAWVKVRDALEAYEAKKTAGNLRTLHYAIMNAPSNMTWAASSLTKHAENVVQRSRADIEAMVLAKASQLGLEPGDVSLPELGDGR